MFLTGVLDSINIITIIYNISNNISLIDTYQKIIIYNSVCIVWNYLLFGLVIPYVNYEILYFYLIIITWTLPHYFISLIYNGVYTNEMVKNYLQKKTIGQSEYDCYNKYSEYLVNKFYYQLVVILLCLESSIVVQIPYIGLFLDCIFSSLVYSYYAWEYSWSYYKIPHRQRYDLFENNWLYYLGYGSIIAIIKFIFDFFTSYHLISIIFPLLGFNSIEKYTGKNTLVSGNSILSFPIFKIPIYYTRIIITKLTKLLQNIQYNKNSYNR